MSSLNQQLRRERELRGWSQSFVAEQIDAPASSYISRWERGIAIPSPFYREKLCSLFGKDAYGLGLIVPEEKANKQGDDTSPTKAVAEDAPVLPALPLVPYHRNLYFTGRDADLAYLVECLDPEKTEKLPYPFALCGLAGMGKTQLAIEYIYRNSYKYQAIFWVNASFFPVLLADFVAIADTLHLVEAEERDQNCIVAAVKRWLEMNTKWLLVLDNVKDLEMVQKFLPLEGGGMILFTMRTSVTGTLANSLELKRMGTEDATLFLLRRAKVLSMKEPVEVVLNTEWQAATQIVELMDGLTLALDQAGAYIEETRCGITGFLELYQQSNVHFLERRGKMVVDHPESVAKTLTLCFEKVQQSNPEAADLLYFCAFLSGVAIPEELLVTCALNSLHFNEMISDVLTYSLLSRDSQNRTFKMHRLIQSLLSDSLNDKQRRQWAERVVQAVNSVFPDNTFTAWPKCQSYLPCVQVCYDFAQQYTLISSDAERLFSQAGYYLLERAQYPMAEQFLQQALHIMRQVYGEQHTEIAVCLSRLAILYQFTGKYEQALEHMQRALSIFELVLGNEHEYVAECLNDLGSLYFYLQQYEIAETYCQKAIKVWESVHNPQDTLLAAGFNNLAKIFQTQGKYYQTEPLLQKALDIWEKAQGREHPDVAFALSNLAHLYQIQHRFEEAEPLLLRARDIRGKALGIKHPRYAASLNDLAEFYKVCGKSEQARALYKQSLHILMQIFGPEHPSVVDVKDALANIYTAQVHEQRKDSVAKQEVDR